MEKVTGIGGFFFRSKNSDPLDDWYEQHLGIRKVGKEYEDGSWWQDEGPTVFASEPLDAQGMGGTEYSWRINFRVRNLDAMVSQLRAVGITVEVESKIYPNGRFAHLCDPDGNHIELWEPAGTDLIRPPDLLPSQVEHGGGGNSAALRASP
jgi:glyoxylase I family protein